MATVTQLAQGSGYNVTTVALANVSVIPGDMLVMFTSSTNGVSNVTNLNGIVLGNQTGVNAASVFWVNQLYGIQTATVTNQTINVNCLAGQMAVILYRVRPDTGNELRLLERQGVSYSTFSTSFATPTVNIQKGGIAIGGAGAYDNTFFTDSGTSGGSWSSVWYEDETLGQDIAVFGQYKIMSADIQNLTYNGSFPISTYRGGYLLSITESGNPYWGVAAT